MGHTSNISSIANFSFYDPVWYHEQNSNFSESKRKIGQWLGEAYNIGQAMCYWILPISGIPIVRSTVQEIPIMYLSQEKVKSELQQLDEAITICHGIHQKTSIDQK